MQLAAPSPKSGLLLACLLLSMDVFVVDVRCWIVPVLGVDVCIPEVPLPSNDSLSFLLLQLSLVAPQGLPVIR
jgi:hypothetical protein